MGKRIITIGTICTSFLIGIIALLIYFEQPAESQFLDEVTINEKSLHSFDIPIFYTQNVPLREARHVKAVMDEYLDNNEDGEIDNLEVLDSLIENRAAIIIVSNEDELTSIIDQYDSFNLQVVTREDINVTGSRRNQFDPTIEEVWHLISSFGYSEAYPDTFGEQINTQIAQSMDIARGGQFESIPEQYPNEAFYTYYDETCEYNCQISKYFYWGLTSLLGGQDQPGRYDEIKDEWKLNTPEKVRDQDPNLYKLLIDPQYLFPTHIPDGDYKINEY
jgi:hypothetical protein